MAEDERMQHMEDRTEATVEQLEGRAEQTVGGMTDDREEQAEGLADEVKGKLRDAKSRLQHAFDRQDSDPGPSGRH